MIFIYSGLSESKSTVCVTLNLSFSLAKVLACVQNDLGIEDHLLVARGFDGVFGVRFQ